MRIIIFSLILVISLHSSSSVDIECDGTKFISCKVSELKSTSKDYKELFSYVHDNPHFCKKAAHLTIKKSNLARLPAFFQRIFPNIRILHIDNIGLTDLTTQDIGGFKKLYKITAANNNLARLSQDLFDSNTKIEHLDLSSNKINEIDVGSIVANKNLRVLKLKDNECVNKVFHLSNDREIAEASRIILKKCLSSNYQVDLSKRRCFLTAMMVGSYVDSLAKDKKKAKKEEERRRKEAEEERARQAIWQQQQAAEAARQTAIREANAKAQREKKQREKEAKVKAEKEKAQREKEAKELLKREIELEKKKKEENEKYEKIIKDKEYRENITKQIQNIKTNEELNECQQMNLCGGMSGAPTINFIINGEQSGGASQGSGLTAKTIDSSGEESNSGSGCSGSFGSSCFGGFNNNRFGNFFQNSSSSSSETKSSSSSSSSSSSWSSGSMPFDDEDDEEDYEDEDLDDEENLPYDEEDDDDDDDEFNQTDYDLKYNI